LVWFLVGLVRSGWVRVLGLFGWFSGSAVCCFLYVVYTARFYGFRSWFVVGSGWVGSVGSLVLGSRTVCYRLVWLRSGLPFGLRFPFRSGLWFVGCWFQFFRCCCWFFGSSSLDWLVLLRFWFVDVLGSRLPARLGLVPGCSYWFVSFFSSSVPFGSVLLVLVLVWFVLVPLFSRYLQRFVPWFIGSFVRFLPWFL